MSEKTDGFNRALIDLKNKQRLMDNRFGDMSPIDNNKLPNMPRGSVVVLSKKVKNTLNLIQEKTKESGKEVPFLLYGKTEGQLVHFTNIDADFSDLRTAEANFVNLTQKLQKFIDTSKKDGTDIVAHGHSHPARSAYYRNFSLGDMNAYKNMRLDNDVFRTGKIELCSCLLTDGNYNFLFFDGNDYYKFNDVFVQAENGDFIEKLPCYNKLDYTNIVYQGRD